MSIGGNISNINAKATDVAVKAKEAAAKAKEAADKAKAVAAKAREAEEKAKKIKEVAERQKEKAAQLKKSLSDKNNFLKDQINISPANAKTAILSAILPILMRFINAEKVANLLINKIINDTKNKLKNKGRVVVVNGSITFTPKDKANYDKFKADFDRKINQIKTIIKTLKDTIDVLMTLLKVVKAAVVAFKVYVGILKIKLKAQEKASAIELASPSVSKPITKQYLAAKQRYDDVIVPLNEQITNYGLIALSITSILKVYQKIINNIKVKLDNLNLTIVSSLNNDNPSIITDELINILDQTNPSELTDIEYTNINDKEFIIRILTTPSGAKQAVAYEKFSNLEIIQTAPSLVRNEGELIEELKQILG
jgi:methyl-accepting chemotaxis protein